VAIDNKQADALGLNQPIARRDFLNAAPLASGSAVPSSLTPLQMLAQKQTTWGGYTAEGDYRDANGNTREVMEAAHAIRDGAFDAFLRTSSSPSSSLTVWSWAAVSAALRPHFIFTIRCRGRAGSV
jgi:hypothetical protein